MKLKMKSVVAFILAMALLAACAGAPATPAAPAADAPAPAAAADDNGDDADDAPAPAAPAADAQEVLFWFSHGGEPDYSSLRGIADDFNVKNPHYNVVAEWVGGGGAGVGITDVLMTSIAGGDPPDMVLFDRFQVGQWASQGLFEELTVMAADAGVLPSDFFEFAWQEASLDGRLYAMPFDTDNRALFVNLDMLAEGGFEPPRTIAELDAIADALTIREGTRYIQFGIVPWLSQGFLYTWAGAFGATFQDPATGRITFDHPQAIAALEWMTDFAGRFEIEHIQDFTAAAGGGDLNPFAAGLVAMMVSGPWEVTGLRQRVPDLNWVAVSIPTPDGSIARTMAGGWSMIVPLGANNVQGGFDLAYYYTVGEGAVRYGEDTTKFMTNINVNNQLRWIQDDMETFHVFVDGFPYSFNRPVVPIGQMLWDEHMTAQNNALFGVDTPENLLRDMNERVNAELQRIGFID